MFNWEVENYSTEVNINAETFQVKAWQNSPRSPWNAELFNYEGRSLHIFGKGDTINVAALDAINNYLFGTI